MKDDPNSRINVAREPRVRINIIENVAVGVDIARINLLVATNKTIQDRFSKVRSERPYLKKFDL
jgi:hypothetical protein